MRDMAHRAGPDLLRRRLEVLGWTQAELASRLGVTPGPVSRWLSGERAPTLEMALRIARVAGVPVEAWEVAGTGTDG